MEPLARIRVASARGRWILLLAALATAGLQSFAFDTGHHVDLTFAVLHERGFEPTAIEAVQVANWLTDYFTVSPTSLEPVHTELNKLHFDNLYCTEEVSSYWGWLLHNTRQAIQDAAAADDPAKALTLMGLFLHATQDFYAHSNWVEVHPRSPGAPYRTETWMTSALAGDIELRSGAYPPHPHPPPPESLDHGGYYDGLNKDSHMRPLWDEAYVFAYISTHEMLAALQEWTEEAAPGFWEKVRTYQTAGVEQKRLDAALEAALAMSMWVKGKGADGHWKGDQSGAVRYLSKFSAGWTPTHASIFERNVKSRRVQNQLTGKLYSGEPPPPAPQILPFAGRRRAVLVQTTYVEEATGAGRRINPAGGADLYAVVEVGAQRYRDRVLRDKRSFVNPWLTLHLADADEVELPIQFEVWDEDELQGQSVECDVNPARDVKRLTFRLTLDDGRLDGDVEGWRDAPEAAFESVGADPDENPVRIKTFVAVRDVETH